MPLYIPVEPGTLQDPAVSCADRGAFMAWIYAINFLAEKAKAGLTPTRGRIPKGVPDRYWDQVFHGHATFEQVKKAGLLVECDGDWKLRGYSVEEEVSYITRLKQLNLTKGPRPKIETAIEPENPKLEAAIKQVIEELWPDWPKNPMSNETKRKATAAAILRITTEEDLNRFTAAAWNYTIGYHGEMFLKIETFLTKNWDNYLPDDFVDGQPWRRPEPITQAAPKVGEFRPVDGCWETPEEELLIRVEYMKRYEVALSQNVTPSERTNIQVLKTDLQYEADRLARRAGSPTLQ